jgi:hypothetical protein
MKQPRMRRARYFNILSADYGQAIALFKRFATKNTEDMQPLLQLKQSSKAYQLALSPILNSLIIFTNFSLCIKSTILVSIY